MFDDMTSPRVAPGVGVSAALSEAADLLASDPGARPGAALVDAVAASERVLSMVAAWQMRALAALGVPGKAGDPTGLARRLAGRYLAGEPGEETVAGFVPEAAESMAAGEVAAILRISPVTAGVRVRDAIRMGTHLPATLQALSQGTIDRGKARVIADFTAPLPAHLTAIVEGRVLSIAQNESTAATRKAVGAAVIAVDPRGSAERHEQARSGRELVVLPGRDGMSTLKAYAAADGAVGIFQLADLLATHTAGCDDDDRSIGARRVDALTDLADQILTHGQIDLTDYLTRDLDAEDGVFAVSAVSVDPVAGGSRSAASPTDSEAPVATLAGAVAAVGAPAPAAPTADGAPAVAAAITGPAARASRRLSRQGRRPHLQVTLGLQTLAGMDDLPGHLAGYGAITAGMARSIAASASTITSLVAEPVTGAVISAGSHQYRPRQDLRDQLSALADSCRFPSCRQPVWRCDIDHRDRFDHRSPGSGGTTTTGNTDPLCRRHHLFKHHTEWTLRRNTPTPADPAGLGVTWTSPTGHTYVDPPRQVAVPEGWVCRRSDRAGNADGQRRPAGTAAADSRCPSVDHAPDPDGASASKSGDGRSPAHRLLPSSAMPDEAGVSTGLSGDGVVDTDRFSPTAGLPVAGDAPDGCARIQSNPESLEDDHPRSSLPRTGQDEGSSDLAHPDPRGRADDSADPRTDEDQISWTLREHLRAEPVRRARPADPDSRSDGRDQPARSAPDDDSPPF